MTLVTRGEVAAVAAVAMLAGHAAFTPVTLLTLATPVTVANYAHYSGQQVPDPVLILFLFNNSLLYMRLFF